MRPLASASLLWLSSSLIAVACGSADKQIAARGEAGQASGGEGGTGTSSSEGGAGARSEVAGAASAGEPSASAGQPSSSAAGASSAGAAQGGAAGASSETVLDLGFDGSDTLPSNLDPGTAVLTPSQGFAELGAEGNKFGTTFLRGPTGTVITLTLSDLPPHTTLSLSMLFAAIDSLDGTGTFPAGDFFKITLDGSIIFRESFANATPDQVQSYEPPPAAVLARHQDLGFGGPGGYYTDSAYDFGQDPRFQNLPHSGSTAVLVFTLEGEGVQTIDDESWAIDNLRVSVD